MKGWIYARKEIIVLTENIFLKVHSHHFMEIKNNKYSRHVMKFIWFYFSGWQRWFNKWKIQKQEEHTILTQINNSFNDPCNL